MARLFDAYIMVDWSAAAKPVTGPNSIWIGILARNARLKMVFTAVNPDTRLKAVNFVKDMIQKLNARGDRVLLGFDFSMGYPAGTADALGFETSPDRAPWQAMADYLSSKVKEKADNSNSRFAIAASMNYAISKGPFPFWGAPKKDQVNTLGGTKTSFEGKALPEYRDAELYVRGAGLGTPKSVWQLAYTGSVGSQSLLGIPHVHHLKEALDDAKLWPFETGLVSLDEDALSGVKTVIAEIYPSLVSITPKQGKVVDELQVEAIARHYWGLDEKGRLAAAFGPPESLDPAKIPQIQQEEGWILGI